MREYPPTAWEWPMKVAAVILRALAKRITWWQAAEVLGISLCSMRPGKGATSGAAMTGCSSGGAAGREDERRARDPTQLYVGKASLAGSELGNSSGHAGEALGRAVG
jgi:hypothetical protein